MRQSSGRGGIVLNINVWFLPVIISFGMSLVHLVCRGMTRKYRKWLSLLGGIAVLAGCFYSLYVNSMYLTHWQSMSILFAVLISSISLFSLSYSQWYNPEAGHAYDSLLFLFIGAMNGVVLTHSFISLYVYWEIMAIASFFLVLFNDTEEARKSSVKYIIMTGAGSIFLLFGILGIRLMEEQIIWKHLFFVSMLIGAGIKAGIIPLHTWLPDAHPAAPTPVSAMLSGVMIKTGVYVFIKFYFDIFQPAWSLNWEAVLMLIGVCTLLGGVFLALVQHDIKRLLAYSSISQIGYIFLGIACGTTIGLTGALYHTINHAVFKSLLFLGAGVLIKATGSRNLEDYGGLSKKLPFTFAVTTIAALSISGVPPFNGFVSKWLIYQALLAHGSSIAVFALAAALLGSVLTLASFIKVINDSFMGVRRKDIAVTEQEKSPFMNVPMFLLAIGCFLFGIFPGFVTERIIFPSIGEYVDLNIGLIKMASLYGWLAIVLFAALFILGRKALMRARATETFVGGEIFSSEATAFDGGHFYGTVKDIEPVKTFYSAEKEGSLDIYQLAGKALPGVGGFFMKCGLRFIEAAYAKGNEVLNKGVENLKLLQSGLLAKYIIWIFVGIIILMEVIRR